MNGAGFETLSGGTASTFTAPININQGYCESRTTPAWATSPTT